MPTINMNFKAQLNFSLNSKSFFRAAAFDNAGKMTVAAAIAKIPKGNCITKIIKVNITCLPREAWNDIYFCPKFFEFTNRYVPNKFPSLGGDHPRMVIPFRTKEGIEYKFINKDLTGILLVPEDSNRNLFFKFDFININQF